MNIYHIPENEQPLEELYAVISKDVKGEGIVSMISEVGHMPLVFGRKRLIEIFKPFIQKMANETGRNLYIVKYQKLEVLETIEP